MMNSKAYSKNEDLQNWLKSRKIGRLCQQSEYDEHNCYIPDLVQGICLGISVDEWCVLSFCLKFAV